MCYPKPGPRCSAHASADLLKKQANFLANPTYEAYKEQREAEEEFFLTPAGHRQLAASIQNEESFDKKYDLEQKLILAVEKRKAAITAVKMKDKGDFHEETDAEKQVKKEKPTLPTAPLPNSGIVEPSQVPRWNYFDAYNYDYHTVVDEYGEGRSVISLNGWDRNPTAEEFIETVFPYGNGHAQALAPFFQGIDFTRHLEPRIEQGYYGQEFGGFRMSEELKKKTRDVVRHLPNADDQHKVLEYARQEGIDTVGRTPLQAIKETIPEGKRWKKVDKGLIAKAKSVVAKDVRFENIDTSYFNLDEVEGYDYTGQQNKANLRGGLLLEVGKDKYVLIGGADRFKAARATRRVKWGFQILRQE